jgi:hypothetical protein
METFTRVLALVTAMTCTPDAIHAKAQYVQSVWGWINAPASDNASPDAIAAKLEKIWDGNGDCDAADASALPRRSRVELVYTHFYGGMMTVAFTMGARQYVTARRRLDDWLQADALIRANPGDFPAAIVSDDRNNRTRMLQFDDQLTKLGYPPATPR